MQTIKSQSIISRLDGIQKDLLKLENLGKLPYAVFSEEDNFQELRSLSFWGA